MSARLRQFLGLLRRAPLVASVQAPNSPLNDVGTLTKLALASANEGVRILRAEGMLSIHAMREATGCTMIGLIKRDYPDSSVRITPTHSEVDELLQTPCEVIALDATVRPRPNGVELKALISQVHRAGKLVLADCDDLQSMQYAVDCGADMVSSTLSGYTAATTQNGPDIELVRKACTNLSVPVLCEGRVVTPAHVLAALRVGASGVVVGGGLNDPIKSTRRLLRGASPVVTDGYCNGAQQSDIRIGAFDIGGTWLRYGCFDADWKLRRKERIPLPRDGQARASWMAANVLADNVSCVGVSTGGVVDPRSGVVIHAKENIIPQYTGFNFQEAFAPTPVVALNDGLASAWAHACLPQFAGKRVATLALGTGVGCGFVDENMQLWMGPGGAPPQLNDLLAPVLSQSLEVTTFEKLMGGYYLGGRDMPASVFESARQAAGAALAILCHMWLPDVVVIAGGVGLDAGLICLDSEYTLPACGIPPVQIVASPLGLDAGLHAAAALALFNPLTLA